jgi:type III secretory pathway component EscS
VAAFQPMFALLVAPADEVITASVCVAALFKALTEVDEETATRIVAVLLLSAALLGQCIAATQPNGTDSVPDGPVN